ncbi:MAG: response regulator [Desulfobacteraceae bacterium]|jgi:DNA-binding NtrC family response regulator
MPNQDFLEGKRVLIVDDEPDILETLEELLDMCLIDTAPNFESARKFLEKNDYDVAILDIMGVQGYDLLKIATQKGIPCLMLTAHALSPDNLVKSLKEGAQSYVPKDKITEIATYANEVLEAAERGKEERDIRWYQRLKPFFDRKFGKGWRQKDADFWKDFDSKYVSKKEELEDIL